MGYFEMNSDIRLNYPQMLTLPEEMREVILPFNWNRPKQDKVKDWAKSDNESHGNCWQHCIAAILQVSASAVPDFCGDSIASGKDMDYLTQKWLNQRGFVVVRINGELWFDREHGQSIPAVPYIACGPTPRSRKMGHIHCVVMVLNEMVYDPHPDATGLTGVLYRFLITPVFRHAITVHESK